jgi:hypothetical protein
MKKGEGNESEIYRTKEQGRDIERRKTAHSAMWYSTGETPCVSLSRMAWGDKGE